MKEVNIQFSYQGRIVDIGDDVEIRVCVDDCEYIMSIEKYKLNFGVEEGMTVVVEGIDGKLNIRKLIPACFNEKDEAMLKEIIAHFEKN